MNREKPKKIPVKFVCDYVCVFLRDFSRILTEMVRDSCRIQL